MPTFRMLFGLHHALSKRQTWSDRTPLMFQTASVGRNETTKTHERQLQFLVYHLEAASLMADQHGVGKMMWLVDFVGYSFMTAPPMRISIQTVHILQVKPLTWSFCCVHSTQRRVQPQQTLHM